MGDVTFEQLDPSEFADWLSRTTAQYIKERMAAGDSREEAIANAEASTRRAFPDRRQTPGQLVGWILWGGQRIGELWVGRAGADPERWWVWDVSVDEDLRGRGFGRAAMLVAEDLARADGATTIGLNVFAHNTIARHLYASLGYHETAVQMSKQLTATSSAASDDGTTTSA